MKFEIKMKTEMKLKQIIMILIEIMQFNSFLLMLGLKTNMANYGKNTVKNYQLHYRERNGRRQKLQSLLDYVYSGGSGIIIMTSVLVVKKWPLTHQH
jgi:hypothetical protein